MPLPIILIGAAAVAAGSAAIGVAGYARNYKYREDEGLDFLESVSSEALGPLVDFLTEHYNSDLVESESYKKHYPDHHEYWDLIATEIQTYGGNTISNIYRGKGINYKEILFDVCDRMNVKYDSALSIEKIEQCLLEETLGKTLDNLEIKERKELIEELGEKGSSVSLVGKSGIQVAQTLLRQGGFATYKWAIMIAHNTVGNISKIVLGKGLPFIAGPLITKGTKFLIGPIGTAISAVWTVYDIHGPAYRVTVPAVFYIIMLRLGQNIPRIEKK